MSTSKPPLLITKSLLRQLRESRSSIVNVASSVAYAPLPFMSVYASSKAFMANWSESLTYELKETNKVITVLPSGTFTQFQKSAGVKVSSDGKGLLTPGYVAKKIETAVKKGTIDGLSRMEDKSAAGRDFNFAKVETRSYMGQTV